MRSGAGLESTTLPWVSPKPTGDLATMKRPARRLRVDALHFDYSYLKERKLYQLMGNFKLLIVDLVKAAPEAVQNLGTKVLLEGKPIQTMGYNSLADLERETRWLLTLQRKTACSPRHSSRWGRRCGKRHNWRKATATNWCIRRDLLEPTERFTAIR